MQDSGLETVGKILDRMSELRVMAQDITKNSGDIENYSKEFVELQSQLNQISKQSFNGISLFATETARVQTGEIEQMSGSKISVNGSFAYESNGGQKIQYDKFGRTLTTHASGVDNNGSIAAASSIYNSFCPSGTTVTLAGAQNIDLGGIHNVNDNTGTLRDVHVGGGTTIDDAGIGTDGFINRILDTQYISSTEAIEEVSGHTEAENGAEQNRVMNSIQMLQTNVTNLEAAHGRIMDADIAPRIYSFRQAERTCPSKCIYGGSSQSND